LKIAIGRKMIGSLFLMSSILLIFTAHIAAIDFDAEEVYESVVVITSGNNMGSGFAIGKNIIITNSHVISDKNRITVLVYQDKGYPTTLLAIDEGLDIAILKIEDLELPFLIITNYEDVLLGSDVYAIGAPKSMVYTITKGILSAKERQLGRQHYLQTDTSIHSGNSGGPLLNAKGEVIGVNTLKFQDVEGIAFAIPMSVVSRFLKFNEIEILEQMDIIETLAEKENRVFPFVNGPELYTRGKGRLSEEFILAYYKLALAFSGMLNIILGLNILRTGRKKKGVVPAEHKKEVDYEIEPLD
jgi:serine protease Do